MLLEERRSESKQEGQSVDGQGRRWCSGKQSILAEGELKLKARHSSSLVTEHVPAQSKSDAIRWRIISENFFIYSLTHRPQPSAKHFVDVQYLLCTYGPSSESCKLESDVSSKRSGHESQSSHD